MRALDVLDELYGRAAGIAADGAAEEAVACTARPLRAATPLAALIRAKQSWGGAPSSSSHCAITRAHCAITSSQETSAGREAAGMP